MLPRHIELSPEQQSPDRADRRSALTMHGRMISVNPLPPGMPTSDTVIVRSSFQVSAARHGNVTSILRTFLKSALTCHNRSGHAPRPEPDCDLGHLDPFLEPEAAGR